MNRAERNAVVVENLPLVGYLVADVCRRATHLSRDDLASAGAVALVTAADAFDPTLGVPFGAYARQRIIGALADEMRAGDWATRCARSRIRQTLSASEQLRGTLGREPSREELADALGVEVAGVDAALADAARTVHSLDDVTIDRLHDTDGSPQDAVMVAERATYVRAAVAALPERMRYITEQVYFADRTVNEIAAELGISHAAVSQQRAEAVRLLRDGLATHYRDDDGDAPDPTSRVAPSRRRAFLTELAALTQGGFTRPEAVRAVS
ncbi:sigma-70 family RNA polymerase sigma factor [Occultella glacieicola]|uniref:Sigma-70 family RNA polymerase sigma factor n=1 Tax=Occultella glacieicola TaxID=2518684 RepID=A0ABY2E4B8_9MICO|nr:sigma-70 family RNA polymerase sigma factor [Occultella glacieicola]TDE94741.1 sigma-70 family RNA polymerase sigma factor [Occultella glacieicola]